MIKVECVGCGTPKVSMRIRYWKAFIYLLLLCFLPMVFLLPRELPSSQMDVDRHSPSYEKIALVDFYEDGRLHYILHAHSMQEDVQEDFYFVNPKVTVLSGGKDKNTWNIFAEKGWLRDHLLRFDGDVRLRERVHCPVELDCQRFIYDMQQGSFLAEGDLHYRRGRNLILADRAEGVLSSGRVHLSHGRSTYDPNGMDCR